VEEMMVQVEAVLEWDLLEHLQQQAVELAQEAAMVVMDFCIMEIITAAVDEVMDR